MIAELLMSQLAVTLPYPGLEYCYRTRDPGCIVETITPRDLAYVNKAVVEAIAVRENTDPYEPWEVFPADRKGDCGARAATVRAALLALGFDPKAMRFEVGEVTEPNGQTLGHIVLLVDLSGKTYVVDSKTPDMIYTPDKRPYAFRPKATQSSQTVVWR
jgi:predicted transglutaminase-like cysteine proteinase